MADWNDATMAFRDAHGRLLATLAWNPLYGIEGGFTGQAWASGVATSWDILAPGMAPIRGVSCLGLVEGGLVYYDAAFVARMIADINTVAEPASKGPPAIEHPVFLNSPLLKSKPVRTYDLSPLANLATAVAWGLALERVVTEWRAWHPAARVTWDLGYDIKYSGHYLRLVFAVDGLGEVRTFVFDFPHRSAGILDLVVKDTKRDAAMVMAPHYVAPTPKGENRDAALRRFADGVRR